MTVILIGFFAVAVGFFAGRALGGGGNGESDNGSMPAAITTKQGSVAVPTLADEKQIPALQVAEPPAEQIQEEGAGEEEAVNPSPVESEAPEANPEGQVTVAPNG